MEAGIRRWKLVVGVREEERNGDVVAASQSGEVLYASDCTGFRIFIEGGWGQDEKSKASCLSWSS